MKNSRQAFAGDGSKEEAGANISKCSGVDYSVEVVGTEEGLLGLRSEWDRLCAAVTHLGPYMTFGWVWTWWQHFGHAATFGRGKHLHVLVLRRDGHITGLAPFILRRASRAGVRLKIIEFLGGWPLGDYNDFLLAGDAGSQVEAVLAYFANRRQTWDLIQLRDVPPVSGTPQYLEQAIARQGLPFRTHADERCPYLPIKSDWNGYLRTRSAETRYAFHKKARQFAKSASEGLSLRLIDSPSVEPGLLDKMVALEKRKQVRGTKTLYILSESQAFFESLLQAFAPSGGAYVAVMEKQDELVAYELGFRCGRKLWLYNKAYDADYARYSPGNLLMAAMFDFGFNQGYLEYDFLGGDDLYKARWTKDFRQNMRFEIWNPRAWSRVAAFLYFRVKPRIDWRT